MPTDGGFPMAATDTAPETSTSVDSAMPDTSVSVDTAPAETEVSIDSAPVADATPTPVVIDATPFAVTTLLTGLEYPAGLFVRDGFVYFTEAGSHDTAFGGKLALSTYEVATGKRAVLVDHPTAWESVAVAADGTIYLATWRDTVPGERGHVSKVDPITRIETHVVEVDIAVHDMALTDASNLIVIGSSDLPTGKSLTELESGAFTSSPHVLATGLGRCLWAVEPVGTDLFFADGDSLNRRDASGTITKLPMRSVYKLAHVDGDLYYADFFGDTVGRYRIASATDESIVTGLHQPTNVAYDRANNRLFFTEGGTDAAKLKDGTLKVMTLPY